MLHSTTDNAPAASTIAVSVVVPLFNERECVDSLVASLAKVERELGDRYDFEFLLVDDGSSDGTVALLQAAIGDRDGYRVIKHGTNRGIAAAIGTGIEAASHEVVVSMDCDGSYDPLLMGELIPLLAANVDLVTASPYHRAGGVENVPLWRLRLSRLASQLYGVACRHKLSCYTSCFRVYRRSAVIGVELENERFVGVAELLCKVLQQGSVVVEHPALLRSRVAGHSKMRVVRASLGHLRLISNVLVDRFRTPAASAAHRRQLAANESCDSVTESSPSAQLV
jgi:glycosyltransferase involved in cell wall biosynthesis